MLYLQKEHILAVGQARFFGGNRGAEITLGELAAAPLIIYRRWQRVIEAAFETAGYPIDPYCVNDDASMTLQASPCRGWAWGCCTPRPCRANWTKPLCCGGCPRRRWPRILFWCVKRLGSCRARRSCFGNCWRMRKIAISLLILSLIFARIVLFFGEETKP